MKVIVTSMGGMQTVFMRLYGRRHQVFQVRNAFEKSGHEVKVGLPTYSTEMGLSNWTSQRKTVTSSSKATSRIALQRGSDASGIIHSAADFL